MMEVAEYPAVADPVNGDDVDGLRDSPFSRYPQVIVPAHGLYVHFLLEPFLFQQDTVIVELDSPIEDMMSPIIAKLVPVLRLSFPGTGLIDFTCRDPFLIYPQGLHELVGTGDFQVPQDTIVVVQDVAIEVELAAGQHIAEPDFAEHIPIGEILIDGMDSLTMQSI